MRCKLCMINFLNLIVDIGSNYLNFFEFSKLCCKTNIGVSIGTNRPPVTFLAEARSPQETREKKEE